MSRTIKKGRTGDARAKGNRGGTGRGNIKPRPCGCPARQHKTTCELSRPFDAAGSAAASNAAKLARSRASKKAWAKRRARRLAVPASWVRIDSLPQGYTQGRILGCDVCRARGPADQFITATPDLKMGRCTDCGVVA